MPVDGERDHARQDDEEGEEDLREGRDERRATRRRHRVGRHRPLYDEEVGAPVAERQHEAQAHRQTEPFDADGIPRRIAHVPPCMRHCTRLEASLHGDLGKFHLESAPSARRTQSEKHQRGESEHDQEELKHFVVDRAGESAEEDVGEHDHGGDEDADVEAPAEEQVEQLAHRVHRDA